MNEALALCEEIQWAKPTDETTLRTLSMVLKSAGKCKAPKGAGDVQWDGADKSD